MSTAWKVSKYGVFSGQCFPVFRLNREIYRVSLHVQSEYGKIQPEKTQYLDTLHTVECTRIINPPSCYVLNPWPTLS